jgi:hypothetical protein
VSENIATTREAPRRELLVFALVLAALIAIILALIDGLPLITRPLWLDEILTVLPARRSSPIEVLADLRAGVDGGAGPLHVVVWAIRWLSGTLPPALLRTLALTCVFAALCLTFAVLRRRFTVDSSAAGALATGSNILVVAHGFEARFYGPWLLCAVFFAWAISRYQSNPARGNAAWVIFASVSLCTVHFYGIISLAVMCAGIAASYGPRWRDARQVLAVPIATGALSVLAIIPLALGQRSAYSLRTWIPEFHPGQLTGLLAEFWLAGVPLIGAAALVMGAFAASRRPTQPRAMQVARHATADAGIVALASLALMPIALALVSLAGQPSMLSRYAITAALAWAPWIAWSMEVAGRTASRVLRVMLAWFWFVSFTKVATEKQRYVSVQERNRATLAAAERFGTPIVFSSIHVMYPAVLDSQIPAARFLDLPDATIASLFPPHTERERRNRGTVIQRDLARVHARRFGFPRLASKAELDSTQRFLLFAPPADLPYGFADATAFARAVFPHHGLTAVHPDVVLLERRRAGR